MKNAVKNLGRDIIGWLLVFSFTLHNQIIYLDHTQT